MEVYGKDAKGREGSGKKRKRKKRKKIVCTAYLQTSGHVIENHPNIYVFLAKIHIQRNALILNAEFNEL